MNISNCPRCKQQPNIEYKPAGRLSHFVVYHYCEPYPKSYIQLEDDFRSRKEAEEAWNELVGQERLSRAAVNLHDFIRSKAGETADWPLHITSSDPDVLERIDALLMELKDAIKNQPPRCQTH